MTMATRSTLKVASRLLCSELQGTTTTRTVGEIGPRKLREICSITKTIKPRKGISKTVRCLHTSSDLCKDSRKNDAVIANPGGTIAGKHFKGNPRLDFPCIAIDRTVGPDPEYDTSQIGYKVLTIEEPFHMKYNEGVLPEVDVAYETWGTLNEEKSNAILLTSGLSASSHAKSHVDNMRPGWWEKFIGPGCVLDTDKFFVICYNNIGGCYGSSGPSSVNPVTQERYGATFPIVSIDDIARTGMLVVDHFGIDELYACIGSSVGGMTSMAVAALFPERVSRLVSISACAKSHPSSIAFRFTQRRCIMSDPNWNDGNYYNGPYPKMGMKIAREIATMTYRSGPEWEQRFGNTKIDGVISLCPTFMIEKYLEHQGEMFSTKYDPNSLLYISKAADLFDMGEGLGSTNDGLAQVKCPVLVMGAQTDMLFPVWQQHDLAKGLQDSGNTHVTYYELSSLFGHDTFLLDLNGVGAGLKGFLETDIIGKGFSSKPIIS